MWETSAIDPASGQPIYGSFTDYGMSRSDNLQSFATEIVEVLSPTNPFGIKAGGEGGCTPARGRRQRHPSTRWPRSASAPSYAGLTLQGVVSDPRCQSRIVGPVLKGRPSPPGERTRSP